MIESVALAKRLNISYRQLDYWTSRGWLQPQDGATGTGHVRYFAGSQVALATRMAALVSCGVSASAAFRVASGQHEDWFYALLKAVEACESVQPPAPPIKLENLFRGH